jgi:hypothetical protein
LVALALLTAPVLAGGANVYPNGAEGFWMGACPPPGVYYVNYDLYYTANEYINNDGGEAKTGPLAGFKTEVFAQVSRVIYISEKKVLGANWGTHLFVSYLDNNTKAAAGSEHRSGIGDIIVDPCVLSWHWPNIHVTAGLDIYLPTADYEAGNLVNLGSNSFVYEPVVAVTYMTPVKGLTVSTKLMYDIAAKNNDYTHPFTGVSGDLKYGEEFHADYSIDYMINENLKAGIGGYYYQQINDDRLNGVAIPDMKGRVWSIGPGVEYVPAAFKGRLILSYRAQFEKNTRNRPEGVANWVKAVWVF